MSMKNSVRWAFNFNSWNPSEAELLLATSLIQPEEKTRLAQFVFKKDFKASLIGRLLMRKYINNVTNIDYDKVKFSRDNKGKPFLENPTDILLNFNVSHQGHYTVLAGEIGGLNIGIDVMKYEYTGGKPISEFFRLMHKNFSETEWQFIKVGSYEQQLSSFIRHWCLKESYVKALGVGITVNLQDISFKVNTRDLSKNDVVHNTELFVKNNKMDWIFEESLLGEEHCVAVAIENKHDVNKHNVFEELTFSKLTEGAIPLLSEDKEYCNNIIKKMESP